MYKTKTVRLVIAQLDFLVGAIEDNASKIINACVTARDQHRADVIVFPELTLTGYPPEDLLLRADLQQRVDAALQRLCHAISGITAIIGLSLRDPQGLRNAAVVIEQGKILGRYYKQALPNYSVFDEKRYFVPGNEACVVTIAGIPTGITICEDAWVAQPAALCKAAGARWLINLNASPYHLEKDLERLQVLQQRVRETGLALLYVNLVGGQDELVFDGESLLLNAHAEVVWRAPAFATNLYSVEVQFANDNLFIPVQSIAPRLSPEASVYQALLRGARDYITNNGFDGAVIGLSGGIDSALTLVLAADAIGAEHLEAVMMPSRFTAQMSREDAQAQAKTLGVRYQEISIEPVFQAFNSLLRDSFTGCAADTTEENIQARCRGIILMAISNKKHKIVLTTGNKSEMAVGYATLYGDMAGGFDLLKDVPKTLVYRLAQWRNAQQPVIPQRVIDRPPSAELRPDQQDTDSLPPYDILDAILERYVEKDQSAAQIITAGYDAPTVLRVIALVDRAEYKRRQAAPGIRITRRAFGRDRRYPMTSGFGPGD
ncbi:MAG: NAD+ synthase [Gammaproteobacteria bacterium]|nr:NAD+ synthase [Gammaproteobacteria bacterium]